MPLLINLALVALLAVTGAPREGRAASEPRSPQVEPHDFANKGMECRSCHKAVVLQRRGSMQKTIGEMCTACHRHAGQSSHPVDMKPSFALPADMPLDERGLMTCATCHDPHRRYLNALTGEKIPVSSQRRTQKKILPGLPQQTGGVARRFGGHRETDTWGRGYLGTLIPRTTARYRHRI